jgi:hypothetical protein
MREMIKRWFQGRELRPTTTLAEHPGVLFMVSPGLSIPAESVGCKIEDAEVALDVVVLDPARKREVLQRVLEWASKP